MTTHVVDISAYTHMAIPHETGADKVITNATTYYPSGDQWAQFIFFHDNSSAGLLVHVADPTPEIQQWKVDSSAETLTITFESDNTPSDIRETVIASANWEVAAAVYRTWAEGQYWWKRPDGKFMDNLNWLYTSFHSSGAAMTTGIQNMAAALHNNMAVWANNYRENGVSGTNYPDYSISAARGYDQAFADAAAMGVKVFPFISGLYWTTDNVDYDHLNMVWGKGASITSVTESPAGTYNFTLSESAELDGENIVIGDHYSVSGSTNGSANNELFIVSAKTSDLIFSATATASIGSISDGLAHAIPPGNKTAGIDLKTMCLDVSSNMARLVSEREALLDINGLQTDVYIDVINGTNPHICYNPNHDHAVGDARQWIDNVRELVTTFRGSGNVITEGWSESCMGLANSYLSAAENGNTLPADAVSMIAHVYGSIANIVGWRLRDSTDDATISALITEGLDDFDVHAIYSNSLTPDDAIFDGTHSISLANVTARRKLVQGVARIVKE